MIHNKQDWIIAAIYRMLKNNRYTRDEAIHAMKTRAKVQRNTAETVNQWLKSIAKGKHGIAYGLKD